MWDAQEIGPKSFNLEDFLISPGLAEISRGLLLPVLDAFCIVVVPLYQSLVTTVLQEPRQYLLFWGLLSLVAILLIHSHGGYRSWYEHRGQAARLAVRCFTATALAMLAVAILLGHMHAVSRFWTTAELGLPPLLLVLTRCIAAPSLVAAPASAGPLVVCFDHCPHDLHKALAERNIVSRPSGVLFLGPRQASQTPWPVIPNVPALLKTVRERDVKHLVFVHEPESEAVAAGPRQALLPELLALPVQIWLAFSLAPEVPRPLMNGAGHYRLVPVANSRLLNSRNLGKRLFDIVGGVLLLAACMPLLGVIALLIRAGGAGPVVFRQQRIGAHDHRFTVLKFRTMKHGPSAAFEQAAPADRRVTRIGRFLRRSSLDELLQLVNVIRGDMSLVGPRPHAPETTVEGIDFEQAVQYYRLRYRVKPGMTGLAQIRGHRGATKVLETLQQRIASDLEYIDTWSIWLDITIMLRTLPTLITQRNAY